MKVTFNENKVTDKDGQGADFYADDISQCIDINANNSNQNFDRSVFSNQHIFNFRQVCVYTAFSTLFHNYIV